MRARKKPGNSLSLVLFILVFISLAFIGVYIFSTSLNDPLNTYGEYTLIPISDLENNEEFFVMVSDEIRV